MATRDQQRPRISFNAIYLDTNILVRSGWPRPSIALTNFLGLANYWKIPVYVPEPVEQEAEQHWSRGVKERLQAISSATQQFARLGQSVGEAAKTEVRSIQELAALYREKSEIAKKQFGIQTTPFTTRPLTDFFSLAVRYVLPFEAKQKGKGFQDAVIFASILEMVGKTPKMQAVIVTEDDVFGKVAIAEFARGFPVNRIEIRTLDLVFRELYENFWDEEVKKPWTEERANALEAAKASVPELITFLDSQLTPSMLLTGFETIGRKVLELRKVQKAEILTVQTPFPKHGEPPDRSVRIAVGVTAECKAIVERQWVNFLSTTSVSGSAVRVEEVINWVGAVEASADVVDRRFGNIKFLSLIPIEQIGEFASEAETAKRAISVTPRE